MDLRLLDAEATEPELAAIDTVVAAPARDDSLRIIRGGREQRSQRQLLLPALAEVQSQIGWISQGALGEICARLGVPPADAYGVATFYELLSLEEAPPEVAHLCDDIVCRRKPVDLDLAGAAVESSPCVGQCDRAPAAYIQRAGAGDDVIAAADPPPVTAGPLLDRVGRIDPSSLEAYEAGGGYRALEAALDAGPAAVIDDVTRSRLRGRGGAAFPTGLKWEAVAAGPAPRYLICNADESEPGTFKDRVLMEGDPFGLVEAMTIAAFATGCERGYVYVRGEYPLAAARLDHAIRVARGRRLLGHEVMGTSFAFDIEMRRGQGAYICGEETALINSIEGYRGEPRNKPPYPTEQGLFGRPTLVNNVETLMNIPAIVEGGGDAYAALGTSESSGTRLFCLSGDIARPGVYEVEFGATLGDLLEMGGGVAGRLAAVLVGGAAGSFVSPADVDLPLTFEAAAARGVSLGSGAVIPFDDTTDFDDVARRIARFFRQESCGQCVPCRVGTVRMEESLAAGVDAQRIDDLARVMADASICGLGHTAASAVRSLLDLGLVRS